MKTKVSLLFLALFALSSLPAAAFCGFYVAKADASLFNNKSEVIIVRDGLKTTITMSNDFKGNVRDFAMVVPVPVVLAEKDIRVTNRRIFESLDAYSAPRLVEYYDDNPCMPSYYLYDSVAESSVPMANSGKLRSSMKSDDYQVTIEAQYQVGEYDILILSAKESTGLKRWLTDNGYKIPAQAEEVLDPYIKSNMKFFVVKVNMDEFYVSKSEYLSPIQITFESEKFMLPIRLGMANADGDQDMIVYAFTRQGRIECTNYRTVKLPTDRNIPLFVQPKFGQFYKDLFNKEYASQGKNAVFLEYAWNVSPNQGVKCDPCVSPPPIFDDFREAGVTWARDMSASSNTFFTRLHVRYSRNKFPEDLLFQNTPNNEHYQCRYVLTHPAQGDLTCDEGQKYLIQLEKRRKKEVDELAALTGWNSERGINYVKEFSNRIKTDKRYEMLPVAGEKPGGGSGSGWLVALSALALIAGLTFLIIRLRKTALA
jgi:hypothetical protein